MSHLEKLIESAYIIRKRASGISGILRFYHYALVISETSGKKYMLHSFPRKGVILVELDISYIPTKPWKYYMEVQVNSAKTIKQLFTTSNGLTNIKFINYLTSGTCRGTVRRGIIYLKD